MGLAKGKLLARGYRPRYVGLGFLWAWIYCTWFSPAVFGEAAGLTVNNSGTWIVSALFVTISLFVSPFLFKRDLIGIPWVLQLAPLANAVGAFAMAHGALFEVSYPAVSLVGAAITGISSGWLWIMWGEFFGTVDLEVTYFTLPLTVAVPLCCILLTLCFQGPAVAAVVCLLPLASGACLYLSTKDCKLVQSTGILPPMDVRMRVLKQGVASFFIYVCISFCWSLVSYEAVGGWSREIVVAYLLGGAAAAATAYLTTIFSPKRDVFGMHRWLVPATSFAFAALILGTPISCAVAFCLITIVQYGFDIVVWIYFTGSVRSGVCTGRFAAGVNRGFVQVGVLVGSMIGMNAPALELQAGLSEPFVILLLLGCMTAAVLMFFTSGRSDFEVRAANERESSACGDLGDADRQSKNCDLLVERYSLTKRERDVLELLAAGRSVPYISEMLVVSKNTVESHVKAIYRKVGVHSRQELLTRLQENLGDE